MKTKITRNIFIFLLAFLGIGAIYGGVSLIFSPSGEVLKMPLSLLENSPFGDYLIPGIILLLVLGITPCLLLYPLLKKPASTFLDNFNLFKDMHWSWSFSLYTAFALIIWLQVQMMVLQAVSWIHTFYIVLAICIIVIGILPRMRELYKK